VLSGGANLRFAPLLATLSVCCKIEMVFFLSKLFSELESTKCFTNLNAYKTIYPLVVDCLNTLNDCNTNNKFVLDIINETKLNCVGILNNLAIGYNKYNISDKLYFYNLSRDCLSKVQSLLILLNSFSVFDFEIIIKFILKFEDNLKIVNGTIRKIDAKK
jgi:hypothetical protein